MKPSKGYYSLIQYCPDLGRLEAANVGVLLFCPDLNYLEAKVTESNQRIKDFFGAKGHDWTRIKSLKKGIRDLLQREGRTILKLEDLENFIAGRANLIQITAPRSMKVFDARKDLDELFHELVGQSEQHGSSKTLRKLLGERFQQAHLEQKIRRDIVVAVPEFEKPVAFPFGFKNGRFNLITPVSFRSDSVDHSIGTACKYALEGRSLYEKKTPDPELGEMQLVVVGQFRADDVESPQAVKRMFDLNRVKLYRDTEIHNLVSEIRLTGKDINPPAAGTVMT